MRDGPQVGQTIITLEIEMDDSCSAIPPLMLRCGFGRTFFFTIITCSTRTLPLPGKTRSTRPCLPLSRPVMIFTVSLRLMSTRICIFCLQPSAAPSFLLRLKSRLASFKSLYSCYLQPLSALQDLRRQRDNLQKLLLAQLAGHGTKAARSYRLTGFTDQHCGILVKADVGTIAPAILLALPDNNALNHHTLLRGPDVRGI